MPATRCLTVREPHSSTALRVPEPVMFDAFSLLRSLTVYPTKPNKIHLPL